jgi:hypothetical protein
MSARELARQAAACALLRDGSAFIVATNQA